MIQWKTFFSTAFDRGGGSSPLFRFINLDVPRLDYNKTIIRMSNGTATTANICKFCLIVLFGTNLRSVECEECKNQLCTLCHAMCFGKDPCCKKIKI